MRKHLHKCLNDGWHDDDVSHKKDEEISKQIDTIYTFAIYCNCQIPTLKKIDMIQYDCCSEWCHVPGCVVPPSEAYNSGTIWKCSKCC